MSKFDKAFAWATDNVPRLFWPVTIVPVVAVAAIVFALIYLCAPPKMTR